MKKILFLTNRNILTTSGEMRLVKNRAESMFNDYAVISDFLVIQRKERIDSKQREFINAGGNLYSIALSKMNVFFLFFKILKKLRELISKNEYDAIVFSGAGLLFFSRFVDKTKIFCDIHGASEDALELAKNQSRKKRLFFKFIFYLDTICMKINSRKVDCFFVVSDALKNYLINRYKMKKGVKFLVVPCATKMNDTLFAEYDEYRSIYRAKYGIKQDEKVFIYSGGISAWQCIPQTIALYEKIKRNLNQKTKLLIFSHRNDFFKGFSDKDDSIIIDSYGPQELSKALFAGDFAFMLREDCVTNNVAFPNKYLEYVQSRMKIITTPYVYEVSKQIREYDLGFICDFTDEIQDLLSYIKASKVNESDVVLKVLKYNSFYSRLREINQI